MGCGVNDVRFLDMNGDGLDDLACVDKKGNLFLSVNQGDGDRSKGKPPTFKSKGKIKDSETNKRERVVLGDIDGDGRGDYGIIIDDPYEGPDGTVHVYSHVDFWRNGGTEDVPKYWQFLGTREKAWDRGDVRMEDINGDVSCGSHPPTEHLL